MRRPASTAQLELPNLLRPADGQALAADAGPALPEPRPASECQTCGWLREGEAPCPVCRAPSTRPAGARRKLPPRRVV